MEKKIFCYRHGKYTFSISLDEVSTKDLKEKLETAIAYQFASFLPSQNKNAELQFHFCENVEDFFPHKTFLNIDGIKYSDGKLLYAQHGVKFVYFKENESHVVYFSVSKHANFKSNCRIINKGFKNFYETQVSLFYYRIFLIFTHLVNIEHETMYIHGATISDEDGNAYLFPADSGVGKSSLLFRMAKEGKYAYIADDLSIVANDGDSYYAGRAISTKPYHLKNFPFLGELVENEMPTFQKIQWKLLKDNRLVFGIDPRKLFKGKIKTKAKIKTIVHLINTSENEFSLERYDPNTLASASANILMNELILGNQILYKALSIPGNDLFLSPGDAYQKAITTYRNFYKNSETYLLEVPYMSHPEQMYNFLVKSGLLK